MRTSKKLAITTVCKKYCKIVCGHSITLAIVFFSFFSFLFNPPILVIQLPQFNFFFFLNFWQYHCWNSLFSLLHLSHHISLISPIFSQNFGNGVAEIRFSPQISLNNTISQINFIFYKILPKDSRSKLVRICHVNNL